MSHEETFTTIYATVSYSATPIFGIVCKGQTFEAFSTCGLNPAVGDVVLADFIPGSGQWAIFAIVV